LKARRPYIETFDDGPGGWMGWVGGGGGSVRLDVEKSVATVRSPWGVDYNHAPPGAGYLNLLYVLMTQRQPALEYADRNRFYEEGHSTDLTGCRFSVRIRGQVKLQGAQLMLLVQSAVPREQPKVVANYVLAAQPIEITPDWSEQTLKLDPDPAQWLCMGTRGEGAMSSIYGEAPIGPVLHDVNVDLILVLFPLDVRPAIEIAGDPHRLRAGKDYPIRQDLLPSGFVSLDEIRIEAG